MRKTIDKKRARPQAKKRGSAVSKKRRTDHALRATRWYVSAANAVGITTGLHAVVRDRSSSRPH